MWFQFSGQWADELLKTYADFCSRHLKAVKLYKELLAKDKRFQCFIRVRASVTVTQHEKSQELVGLSSCSVMCSLVQLNNRL